MSHNSYRLEKISHLKASEFLLKRLKIYEVVDDQRNIPVCYHYCLIKSCYNDLVDSCWWSINTSYVKNVRYRYLILSCKECVGELKNYSVNEKLVRALVLTDALAKL